MYRECASLVSWPLPRRFGLTRTIRRDLRKFFRTGTQALAQDSSGQSPFNQATMDNTVKTAIDALTEPIGGVKLCAPNGDLPTGPWKVAPYLEHRQFPRGRKE
jgi:hypothetical protein